MVALLEPFCFQRARRPAPTWSWSTGGSDASQVRTSSFVPVVTPFRKPAAQTRALKLSSRGARDGTGACDAKSYVTVGKLAINASHVGYATVVHNRVV